MSPVRLPFRPQSRSLRAAWPWLAGLALSLPLVAWCSDVPQLKPMKASPEAGKLAKADGKPDGKSDAKGDGHDHGTKVASAAPAAADPLDTLRQRLAGKLSGGKVSEGGGPMDVHVVAKTAPSPAPAAHGSSGHAAPRAAKAGGHGVSRAAGGTAIAASVLAPMRFGAKTAPTREIFPSRRNISSMRRTATSATPSRAANTPKGAGQSGKFR